MNKQTEFRNKTWIRGWKLLHFLLSVILFALCWIISYRDIGNDGINTIRFWTMIGLYSVLQAILFRTYNAYRISLSRVRLLLYSQALSQCICAGIIYALSCVNELSLITPVPLFVLIAVQAVVDMGWSILARQLYFFLNPVKNTVLVYQDADNLSRLQEVYRFNRKFHVTKKLPASLGREKLLEEMNGCKAVFIALEDENLQADLIKWCATKNLDVYIAPTIGNVLMAGAMHVEMFSSPVIRIIRKGTKAEYVFIKRSIDIFCSLIGIAILWPFMAVTALAVKLYDGGPALYKQVRLTQNGREFKILKFRSMRVDAEKDGVARLASESDSRITPIGKIIRACRFDELPQLFNILMGDMTIVGPRPERPEIAAQYEKTLPEFHLRLQVKAGLTGFAQVYGKYNTNPSEKLQMDLMYINHMSLLEDIKLMLATVKILFMKESTSGIAEGQTTAEKNQEEQTV